MMGSIAMLERFGIQADGTLAFLDDLTGLPNRRFLRRVMDSMMSSGESFSVLFMDLDDFKQVNDSQGHDQGDRLLVKLASLLESSLRRMDVVARYGGDEFVIIAAGGTEASGTRLAEKVIATVRRELTPDWGISFSVGIATFPDHASTAVDLLAMADNAMYSAKSSGKSCWKVSPRKGGTLFWHDDVFASRSGELGTVLGALDPAEGNALIMITGDGGMGKTSLISALADRITDHNVMWMRCRPELSEVPWGALVSAVRGFAMDHPPGRMPSLWTNLLGRLMPEIFGESDLTTSSMDKLALLDAFSTLLSSWTPLVILVDDSQWMDTDTAGLLSYAVRTGMEDGLSVCMAGTHTGEDMPSGILSNIPGCISLELKPLPPKGTDELVRSRLGISGSAGELVEMLHSFSGGNPLFTCEYLRSMLNTGMLHLTDGELQLPPWIGELPERIRDIIGRKLNLLDLDSRYLLQQASVIRGGEFNTGLLMELSERPEGEILNILDRSLKQGILRTSRTDQMTFSFINEAYREEFYRSAGRVVLERSHSVMARRRLAEGDHLAAGHHLERAGELHEALNVYREGARTALKAGLPRVAVACLERADVLGADLTAEELLTLRYELFEAYRLAGDWMKTREMALHHAALADGMDGQEKSAAYSRILAADCLRMKGRYGDALDELKSMEAKVSGGALAECLLRSADNLSRLGRAGEALEHMDRAEAICMTLDGSGCDRSRSDVLHQRLILEIATEDFHSAVKLAEELYGFRNSSIRFPWWFYYDIAETMLLAGRPFRAVDAFSQGVETAMSEAALHGRLAIQAEMLDAAVHALDLGTVTRLLAEVEELAERFSERTVLGDCGLVRSMLNMVMGSPDRAREILDGQLAYRPESPAVAWINSLLLQYCGRRQEALGEVERALSILDGSSMTSIIDLSVKTTTEEMILTREWLGHPRKDAGSWAYGVLQKLPGMGPRAAFTAAGLAARDLHDAGRTDQADNVLADALGRDEWREMRLYRYRNLLIRGLWLPEATDEAASILEGSINLSQGPPVPSVHH